MAGGRFEERMRAWVRQRTIARGHRARLASHLQRQRAWVTKYVNGQVDADLDTTIAIAAYFAVPITNVVGAAPLPRASKADAEVRELLDLWRNVPPRDRSILRGIIELYARDGEVMRSARARDAVPPPKARSTGRKRKGV